MLQAALLLLGCALSHYLWEINVTVASVAVGVTSFGVIFYIFLIVAGTASESCPYQTPGSHALRYFSRRLLSPATSGSDGQTTALDSQCISWMLQTSLDKDVRLLALKHFTTIVELGNVDPALAVNCFHAFISCVEAGMGYYDPVIVQGLQELATASALGLLIIILHLSAVDSTSRVLDNLRQRYTKVFPVNADFGGHQFYHTMNAVHRLFVRPKGRQVFQWWDYKPSAQEHVTLSHNIMKFTKSEYQRTRRVKVPRWILRFAIHSLSLDPLPPTSVVVDCLLIIATDLGCDAYQLDAATIPSDERCVCP